MKIEHIGSTYAIDNVSVLRCEGDGINIVNAIGLNIGNITLYSNVGHGIYFGDGMLNIGTLVGDNNLTLLTSDSISSTFININSFWSERTIDYQNNVIDINNRGKIRIGGGHVYCASGLPQGNAWIRANDNAYIQADNITANNYDAYEYGFRSASRYIKPSIDFSVGR
jgi:hypothetical protein